MVGVSFKQKYVHKVMVNYLSKLVLEACQGKSVVRLTDCLDMTIAVGT